MDEIVHFLSDYGINASVQTLFENERVETSRWVFGRELTFGVRLSGDDPPHWMTNEAEHVISLDEFPVDHPPAS